MTETARFGHVAGALSRLFKCRSRAAFFTSSSAQSLASSAQTDVVIAPAAIEEWFTSVRAGNLEALKALVDSHPSILSAVDKDGNTALLIAAASGTSETLRFLLERSDNTSLGQLDSKGQNALVIAVQLGNHDAVSAILEDGRLSMSLKEFLKATVTAKLEIVQTLAAHGRVRQPSESEFDIRLHSNTPLLFASAVGQLDTVKWLVEQDGAPLTERGPSGYTAVLLAAANGNLEVLRYLLGKGAAIDARTREDTTILIEAARYGHTIILDYLFQSHPEFFRADHDLSSDGFGNSALHYAARFGQLTVVEWLIAHGSAVTEKNSHGVTPMLMAAQGNQVEVMQYLLSKGASLHDKDLDGNGAADYASDGQNAQAADWLAKMVQQPQV